MSGTICFHRDGALPKDNFVFVFGSNLAGRHGRGAAKAAREMFGAKYGNGVGIQGASYAIPTKGRKLEVLSIDVIEQYVNEFIQFVGSECTRKYWITRIGCGLAGYNDKDIAPLFRPLIHTQETTISLPEPWKPFIQ